MAIRPTLVAILVLYWHFIGSIAPLALLALYWHFIGTIGTTGTVCLKGVAPKMFLGIFGTIFTIGTIFLGGIAPKMFLGSSLKKAR